MGNSTLLKHLMLRYRLRRRDLAALLGNRLNAAGGYSRSEVDCWLSGMRNVHNSLA